MPKGSVGLVDARREEIISACEKLYQTMSFKEITLKDIAGATSFTRTSIYNYFQTKEEIFLALMQKEYKCWVEELETMANTYTTMSAESFSSMLAHSLEKRSMLLKLLSMNHFDMEENSRPECLVDFKAPLSKRCALASPNSFLTWTLRHSRIFCTPSCPSCTVSFPIPQYP